MKTLLELFLIFAKIGGFTFGGGYAMLPMLEKEVVEAKGWATNDELLDYFAIGQCTPGIIAVNTATFVGTKIKGTLGGIFATLGVVAPSIVIISIIAAFVSNFQDYEIVQHAFSGVRAAVIALILSSVLKIGKKSVVDIITGIIFLLVALLSFFTDMSPVIFIVVAALLGIAVNFIKARNQASRKEGEEK